jgi:hypothetical protein
VIEVNGRHLVHGFFHDRLGLHYSDDFRGVLHVPDEFRGHISRMDHVAVAVGYTAFIGRTCAMHVVVQRPELLTRRMVRDAFAYPFEVCGCEAVLALVDSDNAAALAFDRRLGFRDIVRVPHAGAQADLIILQMLRAECRWLRKPH